MSTSAAAAAKASTGLKSSVLGGYRRLLRLRLRVFQGDQYAMDQARLQLRTEFNKHRHVQDHRELEGLVAGIREVEEMFSENIVQGRLNEAGNYEVRLRPEVHLKGKEHEMVTHVDDRLVGDTVVVERSRAPRDGSAPGGSCQSGKG
ncbi:hypothetical protein NGA_0427300 [Nannochloropsis gaditana CCMP526]|uniref:Complex 1 LYR protein n=1 Tax=Nannochloropsis gaditana TaxID=72520 RepID=W7T9C0_9STRA|nr:hypothetical protein NGA_0427300 [Nannochloropsis gaditana CCMP526]EKU22921.1 hypothetical protein NGA_0427300 [Nannochloropsis gaditana CCMP526]EWM23620.1 Complex 1 LYR protein [Nannochloropsis gaditana]|eukprot:XP_005853440.1 hypothetical protein NGA_0427300 [Nannochloropsis gaditana CCMP526]